MKIRSQRLYFLLSFVVCTMIVLSLSACHGNNTKNEEEKVTTATATLKPLTNPIYFNAFVEPLSVFNITSLVDGTIEKIQFEYGELVKKGQVLVDIESETLERDYQDKLVKYLKAKQDFRTAQTEWENTHELDRYGLVAKNDYQAAKNKLADSILGRVQAKQELQATLNILEITEFEFDKLDMHNTDEATALLSQKLNRIRLKAPSNGIILIPVKNGKETEKLTLGSPIRKNEVLLTVGDMSGITLNIKVNETQIEHIQPEQKVGVSFIANPKIRLTGRVAHIDTQAQTSNNENPIFPVQIVVDAIPEEHLGQVLVGMSAKLKIEQTGRKALMVPIEAVYQKEGKSFIDVIKADSEKATPTEVRTGPTNLNEVAVLRGLEPGDKIEIRRRVEKYF